MMEKKNKISLNCWLLFQLTFLCFVLIFCSGIGKVYAKTGQDFDPSKPVTCQVSCPYFTEYPHFINGNAIYAELEMCVQYGSTVNCWGDGKDEPIGFEGHACLTIGGREIGGTSPYAVYVRGDAGAVSNTDWVACTFNPEDYINFKNPYIYTSGCNTNYSSPRVYASAIGGGGSCSVTMHIYVDDWYGPGDNTASSGKVTSGSCTVSLEDEIEYYEYEYSITGRSGYGNGSYFSDTPSIYDAGGYCYVTFYTESGKSCSTRIPIPDAPTLTYNLNGDTGTTPSSQKVWAGQSVRIASNSSTKTNCEFLGWSTTKYDVLEYGKTVSNLLSPGTAYTLNSNTTLYAVWRTIKVPYTINFTLNGNKPAKNDFAYITGYVNGGTRVTQSREFSVLEIPGYTVSAKIKSSVLR